MTATYGVVGPNASGKTRLLAELHAAHPDSAFAPSAHHARFAGRTVADHLACARLAHPLFDGVLADRVLAGLDTRTPIKRLSTGEARLVTLAATLAAGTSTVLLDEPFDGLDISHRQRLRELLIELLAERVDVLVIASHRAEDLVGLVDSLITVTDEIAGPATFDELRPHYPTFTGVAADVDKRIGTNPVLASSAIGGRVRITYFDPNGAAAGLPDDTTLINLLAAHGIHA